MARVTELEDRKKVSGEPRSEYNSVVARALGTNVTCYITPWPSVSLSVCVCGALVYHSAALNSHFPSSKGAVPHRPPPTPQPREKCNFAYALFFTIENG